jgi:hypothetical protein
MNEEQKKQHLSDHLERLRLAKKDERATKRRHILSSDFDPQQLSPQEVAEANHRWWIEDQRVVDRLIKNGFYCKLRSQHNKWYEISCPIPLNNKPYTLPDGSVLRPHGTQIDLAEESNTEEVN